MLKKPVSSNRISSRWLWPDQIPGDRNWHFSVDQKFCKIDQEIEKAIGSLGGHYWWTDILPKLALGQTVENSFRSKCRKKNSELTIWYKMSNFIEKHKSTKKRLDLHRLSEVNITYK
jgi:hypothetical protein